MKLPKLFKDEKPYILLDGFKTFNDGYTENPLAHYENATSQEIESEYYMQWVRPLKLHRIALRTPVGFRFVYLYAKDLWNNRLGISVDDDEQKTTHINKKLVEYLISRHWFREMEKLSAFEREQGESILLCYYGDNINDFEKPVTIHDEILRVEAFNYLDYHVQKWDEYGDPKTYRIKVKSPNSWKSFQTVTVDASRVIRKVGPNIEWRDTGYSDLAAIYDSVNILSTIEKAAGEAAFRWGTGHPVFLLKNVLDAGDMATMKEALDDCTRRSWHALPYERVEKIEMLGQAGSMLNLKSLAEICIDNIVIGSAFPKAILLGEISGLNGSEVTERQYFSLLDRDHTELEWFVREYFNRDINIRKLFSGIKEYNIDWGIREVFNRIDEADYQQKIVSRALALTEIATVNEARKIVNLPEISENEGGGVILGLLPWMELQMNLAMMIMGGQERSETNPGQETNTSMKQKSASTKKKAASLKEPEKNKRVAPVTRDSIDPDTMFKDAIIAMKKKYSWNQLQEKLQIYNKTYQKLIDFANSDGEVDDNEEKNNNE